MDTYQWLRLDPQHSYLSEIFDKNAIEKDEQRNFDMLVASKSVITLPDREGICIYDHSEFDSRILDVKTVKILAFYAKDRHRSYLLLEAVVNKLKAEGVGYVSFRFSADYGRIRLVEEFGFRLVDSILYLFATPEDILRNSHMIDELVHIRPFEEKDASAVRSIGHSAFVHGRFYQDETVGRSKADRIYSEWIENSVRHSVCDKLFVALLDKKPVGFVTVKKLNSFLSIGSVELLAVESSVRRKGVGKALILKAMEFFRAQGITGIIIDTQVTNMSALRTYISVGFKPGKTYVTYRLIL